MNHKTNKKTAGISLVSVLTTLVISSFVMISLVEIFKNTKQSYNTVDSISKLSSDARFALLKLQEVVSQAGANFNFPEPVPYDGGFFEHYYNYASSQVPDGLDNVGKDLITRNSSNAMEVSPRAKVERLPNWVVIGCYDDSSLINTANKMFLGNNSDTGKASRPYTYLQKVNSSNRKTQPTVIAVGFNNDNSVVANHEVMFTTNDTSDTNYVPLYALNKVDMDLCYQTCESDRCSGICLEPGCVSASYAFTTTTTGTGGTRRIPRPFVSYRKPACDGTINCGGGENYSQVPINGTVSAPIGGRGQKLVYHRVETYIDGDSNQALELDGNTGTLVSSFVDSDRLEVSFRGDGVLRDCMNNIVKRNELSINTFTIGYDKTTKERSLVCYIDGTNPVTSDKYIKLVKNVEAFKVIYGEDIYRRGYVARYKPLVLSNYANRLPSTILDKNNILNVQVNLVLRTSDKASNIESDTAITLIDSNYYSVDSNITYSITGNDSRYNSRTAIHKAFSRTIALPHVKQTRRSCTNPYSNTTESPMVDARMWLNNVWPSTFTSGTTSKHDIMQKCAEAGFCAFGTENIPNDATVYSNYCVYEQEAP